jgi:hypothetical protein
MDYGGKGWFMKGKDGGKGWMMEGKYGLWREWMGYRGKLMDYGDERVRN